MLGSREGERKGRKEGRREGGTEGGRADLPSTRASVFSHLRPEAVSRPANPWPGRGPPAPSTARLGGGREGGREGGRGGRYGRKFFWGKHGKYGPVRMTGWRRRTR